LLKKQLRKKPLRKVLRSSLTLRGFLDSPLF
jgi:hypothetical protein